MFFFHRSGLLCKTKKSGKQKSSIPLDDMGGAERLEFVFIKNFRGVGQLLVHIHEILFCGLVRLVGMVLGDLLSSRTSDLGFRWIDEVIQA